MKHPTHKSLNTAYAFYYATDAAPTAAGHAARDSPEDKARLGERLNALMKDCLIVAKQVSPVVPLRQTLETANLAHLKAGFDVFNALSLMDNNLFLHDQLVSSRSHPHVAPDVG